MRPVSAVSCCTAFGCRLLSGSCLHTRRCAPTLSTGVRGRGHHQWVFCPDLTEIVRLPKSAVRNKCRCGCTFNVRRGTVERGILTCPHCKGREALIDVARRTGTSPAWRPFALETLSPDHTPRTPLSERSFQRVTDYDLGRYQAAHRALLRQIKRAGSDAMPIRRIPQRKRSDRRLVVTVSDIFSAVEFKAATSSVTSQRSHCTAAYGGARGVDDRL